MSVNGPFTNLHNRLKRGEVSKDLVAEYEASVLSFIRWSVEMDAGYDPSNTDKVVESLAKTHFF
jgi:hypothetical protein